MSGEPDRERNAILRWCVARGRDRREPDLEASIRAGKTSIILLIATNTFRPGIIHTGDLLLWGANTVVLFYETFSSSYSYTRLGKIENPAGLADVLGRGNVRVVRFSLSK
ncbi:MAG: hypothetical protein K1W07_00535 [Parabacteroides distasonis]|nr:hypothetical protein [Parabacteroides sp.]